MERVDLKVIEAVADELGRDLLTINKELKKLASQKCRLKKQKGHKNYDELMAELLKREQVVKEAKRLVDPKEKPVTAYDQDDIAILDYDQTVKAIKSIQSKKANTRWLTAEEGDNDEFRNACKIEAMLLKHKETVKPVEEAYVRRSQIDMIIDEIESTADIKVSTILEMLKSL